MVRFIPLTIYKVINMILIPAEKSNIAWFKLAEFVMRKEKERALAVYRLLEHSFHNEAFAKQIEADLLAAFYDDKAAEKYHDAAHLYEEKEQLHQAFLMYEKSLHFSNQPALIQKLIYLSHTLSLKNKIVSYVNLFIIRLCKQGLFQQAYDFISQSDIVISQKLSFYETFITTALEAHCSDKILLSFPLMYLSEEYKKNKEIDKIKSLMNYLELKAPWLYESARECIT
jgi:hypothetical protein